MTKIGNDGLAATDGCNGNLKSDTHFQTGMITIYLEREKKELEEEFEGCIEELMATLTINPETVVVVKNGDVVSEKDRCKDGDELKFLSVISGG